MSSRAAVKLAGAWRRHGAAVRTHEFGAEIGALHDIISPHQPGQRTDIVYPTLLALLDEKA